MKKFSLLFFIVILSLNFLRPTTSRANSLGDAALTVGISSGVGAVLGLSTLPFYEKSGDYTKNIWIGAAIGAVVGVGISVAAALSHTDRLDLEEDYEAADKHDFSLLDFQLQKRVRHLAANSSNSMETFPKSFTGAATTRELLSAPVVFWMPITTWRF